MRLAVITFHHPNSPLSKIDWGSLRSLHKWISVLRKVSTFVVILDLDQSNYLRIALEVSDEPQVLCRDTSGSCRREC